MFTVDKLSKDNYGPWDSFVKNANNGTIFHLRKFFSYHPNDRFIDHSIEFYKNKSLFSVFPAAELITNKKTTDFSVVFLFVLVINSLSSMYKKYCW